MTNNQEIVGGLLPTPHDPRDFSLGALGGLMDPNLIPNETYIVAEPLAIKNQGPTDYCTAFAACAVSEDQEGVLLDPAWFFAQIKKIRGEYGQWGADLRSGCKAAQKVGFLEESESPFGLENKTNDFLRNWNNWPADLYPKAQKHIKKSFFKVEGPYDTFDNIRAALWQNRGYRRSVYTGCLWKSDWTDAEKGIIPKGKLNCRSFGHAFKVSGQKIIDGVPYLVVVNSAGDSRGHAGLYYFPREVVNRDFTFGAYMFIDMDPEVAKNLNDQYIGRIEEETKQDFWGDLKWFFQKYFKL